MILIVSSLFIIFGVGLIAYESFHIYAGTYEYEEDVDFLRIIVGFVFLGLGIRLLNIS